MLVNMAHLYNRTVFLNNVLAALGLKSNFVLIFSGARSCYLLGSFCTGLVLFLWEAAVGEYFSGLTRVAVFLFLESLRKTLLTNLLLAVWVVDFLPCKLFWMIPGK